MRSVMMLVLAGASVHHTPAKPQQLSPKVFQITNLTTAMLDFHVLASPSLALTATNDATLASGASATFGCGSAKCYVVMTPPFKGVGKWGVHQGSKYKFSVVGHVVSLNLTS